MSDKTMSLSFGDANVEIDVEWNKPVVISVAEKPTEANDYHQEHATLRLSKPEVEEFMAALQFMMQIH